MHELYLDKETELVVYVFDESGRWFIGAHQEKHPARMDWSESGEPWATRQEAIDFAISQGWITKAEVLKVLVMGGIDN